MLIAVQAALVTGAIYLVNLVATAIPDANLVVNLASLAILIGGAVLAPRAWRAKSVEGQLKEKDVTIHTHEQTISALREREQVRTEEVSHLRSKVEDCEKRAQRTHAEAAMWSARYQEQSQYTAGPALEALKEMMGNADREAERRHTELLEVLRGLNGSRK